MSFFTLVVVVFLGSAALKAWKEWKWVAGTLFLGAAGIAMGWLDVTWVMLAPAVVVVLILWPIIRAALGVRKRRMAPDRDVVEIRNPSHQATEALDKYFERQGFALAAAGFTREPNDIVEVSRTPNGEWLTFLRLYTTADTRVTIAGSVGRYGKIVIETPPLCVCTTRLASDQIVVTSNNQERDSLPSLPHEIRIGLPSFREVADLLAAHRVHVQSAGHPAIAYEPVPDWIAEFRTQRKRAFEYLVSIGLMDHGGPGEYRLTTRGVLHYVPRTHTFLSGINKEILLSNEKKAVKRLGLTMPPPKEKSSAWKRLKSFEIPALALFVLFGAWYSAGGPTPDDGTFNSKGATLQLPADIVVPDSFSDAVHLLETLTGQQAALLKPHPDVDATGMDIMAIPLRSPDARLLIIRTQQALAAKGFLLFHTNDHGDQYRIGRDAIALAPYTDPYQVMRRVQTNGDNSGITTDSVIAWFRETERELPIRFTDISFDFVGAVWDAEIRNQTQFGKRFLQFCPGLDFSPVRAGKALQHDKYLFCWWD